VAKVLLYEIYKWLKVITKLGVFKHTLTVAGGVMKYFPFVAQFYLALRRHTW
jgi:hypothetical protein